MSHDEIACSRALCDGEVGNPDLVPAQQLECPPGSCIHGLHAVLWIADLQPYQVEHVLHTVVRTVETPFIPALLNQPCSKSAAGFFADRCFKLLPDIMCIV